MNIPHIAAATLLAPCLLAVAPATAQSVNIDFGTACNVPTDDHAAVGLPGVWNGVEVDDQAVPLVGLDGNPTGATVALTPAPPTLCLDDAATGGNDAALMDDLVPGLGDVVVTATISGLAPGVYQVITYAWPSTQIDQGSWIWIDSFPSEVGVVAGQWPGGYVEGVTHAQHIVETDGEPMVVSMVGMTWGQSGVFNGIQLVAAVDVPADVNNDGHVDIDDLLTVLQNWTTERGHGCDGVDPCPGDVDGDGRVGVDDLMMVLEDWTG